MKWVNATGTFIVSLVGLKLFDGLLGTDMIKNLEALIFYLP